ncbi:immunity protein Imm33 domain-containing protein [Ekhidna sp.]
MKVRSNQSICEWQGVLPVSPTQGSNIGLAVDSIGEGVIHGLRHIPEKGTNGWYIWCGNYSEAENFFSPICIDHLEDYFGNKLTEYLELPPGYRFMIDGDNHEDVWFDKSLIE